MASRLRSTKGSVSMIKYANTVSDVPRRIIDIITELKIKISLLDTVLLLLGYVIVEEYVFVACTPNRSRGA